jgi:hypothetical protein
MSASGVLHEDLGLYSVEAQSAITKSTRRIPSNEKDHDRRSEPFALRRQRRCFRPEHDGHSHQVDQENEENEEIQKDYSYRYHGGPQVRLFSE